LPAKIKIKVEETDSDKHNTTTTRDELWTLSHIIVVFVAVCPPGVSVVSILRIQIRNSYQVLFLISQAALLDDKSVEPELD
jgi:hypothetical protein